MSDREARDIARFIKNSTPSPKKKTPKKSSETQEDDKENINDTKSCRKSIIYSPKGINQGDFSHPVYKEISLKNGIINKSDLSSLKKLCKDENIDSAGKRPLLQQRLKTYFKNKMLREAGLRENCEKFDYFLVVDFEATCEERNSPEYPHEIIEFPGVLVDGLTGRVADTWREHVRPELNPQLSEFCVALTGIQQTTVDTARTFPAVLAAFSAWLESHGLGSEHTFALVTDGPFDVGRFLRLSCAQYGLEVPAWARRWVNLRKGFANFYRFSAGVPGGGHQKLPGLQTMLARLDLEFEGSQHCGLDDAKNIARVVARWDHFYHS